MRACTSPYANRPSASSKISLILSLSRSEYCPRPLQRIVDRLVCPPSAERAVEGNLLFDMLSLPARQAIFRSMSLHMVSAGITIINQGDTDATKFYVLEKGTCDVLITNEATGNVPRKVHTYPSGRYICCATLSTKYVPRMDVKRYKQQIDGRNLVKQRFWGASPPVQRASSRNCVGRDRLQTVGDGESRL